ncbi:MAG: DUF4272 domain-containing protein [Candidatus Sericytochromatia bacterium]
MGIKDIFSIFRSNKSPDDSNKSLTEALKYLEQNKPKDAENILRKYIKNNPNDLKSLKTLGLCLIKLNNYDEAIESLSNVLKIQTNDLESYNYIFEAFIKSQQYKKGEKFFKYAIKNNTNQNELYFYLARIYEFIPDIELFNKNLDKAVKSSYKDAISWKENNLSESYTNIINSLINQARYKELIDIFNKNIGLSNNSDLLNLAIAYREIGQIEKAESILKEIILKTKESPIPKAFYELGLIYKQSNREKEAEIFIKDYGTKKDYSYIYNILENSGLKKDKENEYIIYSTKNNIDINKLFNELNLDIIDNYLIINDSSKFEFYSYIRNTQEFNNEIRNLQEYIYTLSKNIVNSQDKLTILEEKVYLINKILLIKDTENNDSLLNLVKNITKNIDGFILKNSKMYNNDYNLFFDKDGFKENIELHSYENAISRKNKNNLIIQSRGFNVPENLPLIVCEEEVNFKKPQDIAKRAIVLFYLIKKVQGLISKKELKDFLLKEDLIKYLDSKEESFLKHSVHSKNEIDNTLSKLESIKTMLWVLKHIFHIGFVDKAFSLEEIKTLVNEIGLNDIINSSELRPIKEILDHYDLVYRLFYYLKDMKNNNIDISETKIDERIVSERLSTLRWLLNINS